MCFSATASFTSAAVLLTVGAGTLSLNQEKENRMFAAIPILFGIQQASEGVVWLTIGQVASADLLKWAVITFLAFALVIWPS